MNFDPLTLAGIERQHILPFAGCVADFLLTRIITKYKYYATVA